MHGHLISAVPGPQGALAPTTSSDTPATEEERADAAAEAPSGEITGNTTLFISGASDKMRAVLFNLSAKWKPTFIIYIHLYGCKMKIWFICCILKDSYCFQTPDGHAKISAILPECPYIIICHFIFISRGSYVECL